MLQKNSNLSQNNMNTEQVKAKWTFEGPRWAGFDSYLREANFYNDDIEITFQVNKGWLRNTYLVEITGPHYMVENVIKQFQRDVENYNDPS